MRDVRLDRDAKSEKHKRSEELKVDELMGEAEAAGGKVDEGLLVNEDNIVDASDANREDADKERDESKKKIDSGEEKQNQDNKLRRLQLLDKFPEGCLHSPSRHHLNRILSALEFGPTTKEGCTIDASIINAVQGADGSPPDEDAGMERWRMM